MKTILAAIAIVLAVGVSAEAACCAAAVAYYPPVPTVAVPTTVYYPAPVYAPVYVAPRAYTTYYSPVVVPAAPAVIGVPPAVVGPRGRVYYYGRPVRNAVRATLPF